MIPASWLDLRTGVRHDGRCEAALLTPRGRTVFRAVGQRRDGSDLPDVVAAVLAWAGRRRAVDVGGVS